MAAINEVLHKIEAKLYPNYLGEGADQSRSGPKGKAFWLGSLRSCANSMANAWSFGFAKTLRPFGKPNGPVCAEAKNRGGFSSLQSRIGGTFHGPNDHTGAENLHIAFRTLTYLKALLANVKIVNEGIAGDGAYIDEIIDVHTESLNSAITPGNMIHLLGHKSLFKQTDGSRTRISGHLGINRGTELFGLIPPLNAGVYKLEVVTQFTGGSNSLKEPGTIAAQPELTAA